MTSKETITCEKCGCTNIQKNYKVCPRCHELKKEKIQKRKRHVLIVGGKKIQKQKRCNVNNITKTIKLYGLYDS
jgi:hypothetical protein